MRYVVSILLLGYALLLAPRLFCVRIDSLAALAWILALDVSVGSAIFGSFALHFRPRVSGYGCRISILAAVAASIFVLLALVHVLSVLARMEVY